MAPPVIWRPTEKQAEFLAAPEDEVLYGGGAGSGKSDALVVDALGGPVQAIAQSEYRALILRRTYGELKEVIDRTRALYPPACPGAAFHQQDSEWRFPSGARIELSYLGADSDALRYQSRQYQWIGFEELAQWPTDYAYTYMLSRLRAPERLAVRCYVRATCNPDGPGARWIAKRWGILPAGDSTASEVMLGERTWRRRFIAARLADNPHLSNTGYREQLMLLPDEVQRTLLHGRWDEAPIGGAIYGEVIAKAREEKRITRVPYDPTLPVDTAWDLGIGDSTSIWFSQSVGRELRLIDFYEASGEGFPHYKSILDKRYDNYGKHIAPHDIRVREIGSGRSRIEVAEKLGIKFDIAPNIPIEDGIHAVRSHVCILTRPNALLVLRRYPDIGAVTTRAWVNIRKHPCMIPVLMRATRLGIYALHISLRRHRRRLIHRVHSRVVADRIMDGWGYNANSRHRRGIRKALPRL